MKRGAKARGWAGLIALLLTTLAATAYAKPVVAVAPFHGPTASLAEQTVQKALKKMALVLSSKRYALVSKGLIAETAAPEDVAAVASQLGAAWVVTGVVKRDGHHWVLTVSLRDGPTGKARARLRYTLSKPRLRPSTLRTLSMEIVDALHDALSSAPPDEPSDTPPPPSRKHKPTSEQSDTPPPHRQQQQQAAEEPSDAPPPTTEPKPAPKPQSAPPPAPANDKRPGWARWFDISAGLSLTGRHFATDPQPPVFHSAVVAGIHLDATFYPLTSTWRRAYGIFSGIGLGITLDKPFWPPSTTQDNPTASFPTTELRVEGGLRWKITLYKAMPRPQLMLIAQGGLHQFTFAKGPGGQAVVDVPDVGYVYLSLGGQLKVHFAEWSWIWLQFVYHVVTTAGPIQSHDEYGAAYTFGLRLSGGLDFLVYKGIHIGVNGFYERFQSRFGYDRTATKLADTSTDEYYGGALILGYVF